MNAARAKAGLYSFKSRYAGVPGRLARSARALASRHPEPTRKCRPWTIAAVAAAGRRWQDAPGAAALAAALGVAAAMARKMAARAALTVTGGLRVRGASRLPATPCVIVANHYSRADTAALIAALPARRRPVCRDVGRADLLSAARLLAAGHDVVIYPEGTRSRAGGVAEFRPGAARLAALARVPLVPVGITGSRRLLPAGAGARARRGTVTVRVGMPVPADAALRRAVEAGGVTAAPAAVAADVVARVTATARAQVVALAAAPGGLLD